MFTGEILSPDEIPAVGLKEPNRVFYKEGLQEINNWQTC